MLTRYAAEMTQTCYQRPHSSPQHRPMTAPIIVGGATKTPTRPVNTPVLMAHLMTALKVYLAMQEHHVKRGNPSSAEPVGRRLRYPAPFHVKPKSTAQSERYVSGTLRA